MSLLLFYKGSVAPINIGAGRAVGLLLAITTAGSPPAVPVTRYPYWVKQGYAPPTSWTKQLPN